jgi:hypothetical protein
MTAFARELGVALYPLWSDSNVIKLRLSVWNGRFGGTTDLLVGLGELSKVVEHLKGFPSGSTDTREVVLGEFGPEVAGGAARLYFFCRDDDTSPMAEMQLEGEHDGKRDPETVTLVLTFEPASLGIFLRELQQLDADRKSFAYLRVCA